MTEKISDTNVIQQTILNLPEQQEELDDEYLNVSTRDIYNIIDNEMENSPLVSKLLYKDGTQRFQAVLIELDKLKDKLGGSPAFGDTKPYIDDGDSQRVYFGIPLAAIKDWLIMTQKNEWLPQFFWHKLGELFGATKNNMSQYEDAYIRIQRFGQVVENKPFFLDALNSADETRYSDFSKVTGLAWHPNKNSAGVERVYMDFIEYFLTDYFEEIKQHGEQALLDYFNAFSGVCFEDRARNLEQFLVQYPPANADGCVANEVADWTSSDKCTDVFMKEATLLAHKLEDSPTISRLLAHLQDKEIFSMEFTTDSGEKKIPTEQEYHSWATEQVEYYILVNDDNDDINLGHISKK